MMLTMMNILVLHQKKLWYFFLFSYFKGKPVPGTPAYKSQEEYYDQIQELKKVIGVLCTVRLKYFIKKHLID